MAKAVREDLQRKRRPRPQQGKHTKAKRNIGSHRYAPTPELLAARVECYVEKRGNDHSAQRGEDGQCRLPYRAQFAYDDRPLDLKADNEEEDRHEAVVDPVMDRLINRPAAEADNNVGLQQLVVGVIPGGIGPDQRHHRRHEQHDAARRLLVHEPLHGAHQLCDRRLGMSVKRVGYSIHTLRKNRVAALRLYPSLSSGCQEPSRRLNSYFSVLPPPLRISAHLVSKKIAPPASSTPATRVSLTSSPRNANPIKVATRTYMAKIGTTTDVGPLLRAM